jgi:MFS family permease
LPLELFSSRTFSVVNLLTLLLYAALGGAFFFLPFALIQVAGFSAVLAGTVFLPFTLVMAALSRWSGGLLDRFGAKWLLIVGPALAGVGFGLLAFSVGGRSYWAFLAPITVIAFGMVVTVAPLTTTVINAVPAHQTGVAAGINNAVASVANLLAVAILGALALGIYNHALDRNSDATLSSAEAPVSREVQQVLQAAHGQFVSAPALSMVQGHDRQVAKATIERSLAHSIRIIMLICAALALAGAACSALFPQRATAVPDSS